MRYGVESCERAGIIYRVSVFGESYLRSVTAL